MMVQVWSTGEMPTLEDSREFLGVISISLAYAHDALQSATRLYLISPYAPLAVPRHLLNIAVISSRYCCPDRHCGYLQRGTVMFDFDC